MNLSWLAHAEEFHGDDTSQATHLLSEWWAGLLLFGLFLALVFLGPGKRLALATRLSLTMAVSLLIGLVFYRWTPILSAVAITLGFVCSLALTLGGAKRQ